MSGCYGRFDVHCGPAKPLEHLWRVVEGMRARILVVEDDPAVLTILEAAISYGGFAAYSVRSGLEAIELLRADQFDAILLDMGLPDIEGEDLLRSLREISDLPIIVVSGRGAEADKIGALDLGADDYVPKPFMPGELLARIRAVLRRHIPIDPDADRMDETRLTRLGRLTIDPRDHTASIDGRSVSLTDAEFKVVRTLAANRITPVSRAALLDSLYGDEAHGDTKIVEVYLGRIRNKLRTLTGDVDLIENQRGRGWILRSPN